MSLYMGRVGRKKGFVLAAVLLAAGGLLGVFAMILQHFILLCVAHFVMGAAFVGINFLRFAAAEAVSGRWTSNAISFTLASGLIAAFIGPEVFSATKDMLPSGGLCRRLCCDRRAWQLWGISDFGVAWPATRCQGGGRKGAGLCFVYAPKNCNSRGWSSGVSGGDGAVDDADSFGDGGLWLCRGSGG